MSSDMDIKKLKLITIPDAFWPKMWYTYYSTNVQKPGMLALFSLSHKASFSGILDPYDTIQKLRFILYKEH